MDLFEKIFDSLLNSGFTKEGDRVFTRIYDRRYDVTEHNGTIYVESKTDIPDKEAKTRYLDAVEDISGRYGIVSGGFNKDNLYVVLSVPTDNTSEEVRRIKFLIQSLNRITDSEEMKEEENRKHKSFTMDSEELDTPAYLRTSSGKEGDKDETSKDNPAIRNPKPESAEKAKRSTGDKIIRPQSVQPQAAKEDSTSGRNLDENAEIVRATARKGSATYGAYGYTKDREGNKKQETYMTNENMTYENTRRLIEDKKPETILVPVNRDDVPEMKGTAGAIMGVFLSLIILGFLHKIGFLGHYLAFIMGILAYVGYRSLSRQKKVPLLRVLVPVLVGILILAVVMNAIEIQEALKGVEGKDITFGAAMLRGLAAFFNNRVYDVPKNYEQIAISLLSALLGIFGSVYFMDNMESIVAQLKSRKPDEDDLDELDDM